VRLRVAYEGLAERIGGLFNLVPEPIGFSMYGMAVARSLQVAERTGLIAALAEGEASADELAARCELRPAGTRLLLDSLTAAHLLRCSGERYSLDSRAKKWLDPASESSVAGFLADNWHYWDWYAQLEPLIRDGQAVDIHAKPPDDPYWRSYMRGQYEIARLSSNAVAKAIKLREPPRSLLDVAGGHGEFSMALCRRHPELRSRIVDLPGSAAVGREIVAAAGMSDRVEHVEGDMFVTDLGGPHDGALCFNIVHHLSPEQIRQLFARIAAALAPGAPLVVLDLYTRPPGATPDSGALLGLFFHLTSGADTYSTQEVEGWLADAGLEPAGVRRLPQLPGLALVTGRRRA
jgi:hypothetical protein